MKSNASRPGMRERMPPVGEAACDESRHEQADHRDGTRELGQRIAEPLPRLVGAIGEAREVDHLQAEPRSEEGGERLVPFEAVAGDRRLSGDDQRRQVALDGRSSGAAPLGVGDEADVAPGHALKVIHRGPQGLAVARALRGERVGGGDQFAREEPARPPFEERLRRGNGEKGRERHPPRCGSFWNQADEAEEREADHRRRTANESGDAVIGDDEVLLGEEDVPLEPGRVAAEGEAEKESTQGDERDLQTSPRQPRSFRKLRRPA